MTARTVISSSTNRMVSEPPRGACPAGGVTSRRAVADMAGRKTRKVAPAPSWLERYPDQTVRIPMADPAARCLNLATAATVILFEALRQLRRPRAS